MSQKQIPTKLNKGHQEKQNTFLVRMSKQFSSKGPDDQPEVIGVYRSPQDISILLRKLGATYNPEKEQVLEELLEKTIQQSLRDKWLERMKPVPPEKCPMPDCEGIISRRDVTVAYITGHGLKTQEAVVGTLGEPVRIEPSLMSFEKTFKLK